MFYKILLFAVWGSFLLDRIHAFSAKPILPFKDLSQKAQYDLQWYVIGTPSDFSVNVPKKTTIWGKDYVVWKDRAGGYHGLDNVCSHKGASLSGGKIRNQCAVCPYHGYEFTANGVLETVPGIPNHPCSPVQNIPSFRVVEKSGWVYLNTCLHSTKNMDPPALYEETKELTRGDSSVFLDMDFNCYARVLSENSLDVMHIGFVHTFGNRQQPAPTEIHPPKEIAPYHFKTTYAYETGKNSMAYQYFESRKMTIENEFYLPHTTVARVIFGQSISTVITFALPINETCSRLYVKTYRNFWKNQVGDELTRNMMYQTMLQDKAVVEGIYPEHMDGRFNMKFDKLQNTYKAFYRKWIRPPM
jgi:phenylpropionate dioxygenase-like ring-hydroxylating dioxygenase large terminal subunit